jgi:hypothetical protein
MALALVATLAALLGYFAMTYSPVENVAAGRFAGGLATIMTTGLNPLWIVGGLTTGPVFGLLGQRWRVARSPLSAFAITAALCLEPVARSAAGMLTTPARVWASEVVAGVLVGLVFVAALLGSRGSGEPTVSS